MKLLSNNFKISKLVKGNYKTLCILRVFFVIVSIELLFFLFCII